MEKKAKRFNAKLNEFEKISYSKDLLFLEKYRYLCTQIMMINWKIKKLKQALLEGTSYSSTEAEKKIEELEKRMTILSSKMVLAHESTKDVEKSSSAIKKNLLPMGILEKYSNLRTQMIEVEKTYGRLVNIKAPKLFSHLTMEVSELRDRLIRMEDALGETEDDLLSARLEKTKEYLKDYEVRFEDFTGDSE